MKDLTAWWVPIVVGVIAYAVHNATFQPWTLDDAYITFRYADNLAAGLGPVYNEGEQVEGYTTFLWMIMLAATSTLGLQAVWVAKVYGLLASMTTLTMVSLSHRIVPGLSPRVSWYAALLVATNPILTRWSMSGMEVPLVGTLLTAGLLVHLRDRAQGSASPALAAVASLLCVLAAMTRPDAGLLFGVLGLDRLWQLVRRREGALTALVVFSVVFGALYGGYFAWRFDYYGWLLPNTFYVKVGATSTQVLRGLYYLSTFLIVGSCYGAALAAALLPVRLPAIPLAIVSVLFGAANIAYIQLVGDAPILVGFTYFGIALAVLSTLRFRIDNGLMVGAALAGLHTVYVVLVGGDVMYGYRFFTALLPTMALLAAAILYSAADLTGRWRQLIFWTPLALNVWWGLLSQQLNAPGRVSERGIAVGHFLREHAPPDALVAVNVAGTIPYYSKLRAIDTLGLNDEHIAHMEIEDMGAGWAGHEKGDGEYVLSRAPDYVIFASAHGSKKPRFRGDHDLFDSELFQELYDLYVYPLETDRGEVFDFTVWQRRPEHGGAGLPGAEASKVIKGDLRASLPPREQRHNPTATWW